MNKVNTNNGSLSLTGLHAKTAGDNLCREVLHKLSPTTICAGDNICREYLHKLSTATIYAVTHVSCPLRLSQRER